jgi:uncharacterized cofD-like protein
MLDQFPPSDTPREAVPKIVTIGGGTGNFTLLSGLRRYRVNLTAIVNMIDSGGSSGRLRDELGLLPPGDLRRCLVALAPDDERGLQLRQLFNVRFRSSGGLDGHNFGNLFLAAATEVMGGLGEALDMVSKLLNIQGRVLPVTLTNSNLCARLTDGSELVGEHLIGSRQPLDGVRVSHIRLDPPAYAYPEALRAIYSADLIILGPGDLYTSVLPILLVNEVAEAITSSKGKKVYVCNLMTRPGETDGFTASQFLREVCSYLGGDVLDAVVVNTEPIPEHVVTRYRAEGSQLVLLDEEECRRIVPSLVKAPLLARGTLVRHDPRKLANVLVNQYNAAKVSAAPSE